MTNNVQHFDCLIIGGGIFGIYAALYLSRKGMRVVIVEKEQELLKKASIVNQARLHSGYHYPRSIATALMSDDHKARFTDDHKPFIHFEFEKYYAIERYGSFTDSAQFERFCRFIDIPLERVKSHPLFDYTRIESLYKTVEYSFDPILIAEYYKQQLREASGIEIWMESQVLEAQSSGEHWEMRVQKNESTPLVTAPLVINATYSGSNSLNRLFGLGEIDLMHEISEIAFITCPPLQHIGLTVMDGQFGSIMPYGKSGLLSVSSVAYTHHKVSYANVPEFDCMAETTHCQPNLLGDCNTCPARPRSNYRKMLSQMQQYFSDKSHWQYFHSYFTIKSKLRANHIDDGRPTEISHLHRNPDFYCIFAGKINSIYEIERVV